MNNEEKDKGFQISCLKHLEKIGFSNLDTKYNRDYGADIIGTYNGQKYIFQCKNHQGNKSSGYQAVQAVVTAKNIFKANRCVVISASEFSEHAITAARDNSCILIRATDFFKLDSFPPKGYSEIFSDVHPPIDYSIGERFDEYIKKLKRTPKLCELDKTLQYEIRKKYGNYTAFLKIFGVEKFNTKPTPEELQKEYLRIKEKIGKKPTLEDIKNNTSLPLNSFRTYPFSKLQQECGDSANISRNLNKEELIKAYFSLEKKLGHPPKIKEINECGIYRTSSYRRLWGTLDNFFKDIGRSRTKAGLQRRYTQDELVLIYFLLSILFSIIKEDNQFYVNHTVLENLMYNEKLLISPGTFSNRFKSWDNFTEYLRNNHIDELIIKITSEMKSTESNMFFSNLSNFFIDNN